MRKNLSGKTEFCKHTRNSQKNKRGVNKAERKAPLPNEDEPAAKHRKKSLKPKQKLRFHTEFRSLHGWVRWSSHTSESARDRELASKLRTIIGYDKQNGSPRFRAIDDQEPQDG